MRAGDRSDIQRQHIFWALLCLVLALIPHASRFSPWLLVCFCALATWRVLGEFNLLPLPTRQHLWLWILKQLLALAAFTAIYISYQGQLGRDAGVALLTALLGLKMLELNRERDYYITMFLAYFLVVTNFFYSQTLATAAFMLLIVMVVTGGLISFNAPGGTLGPLRSVRLAGGYVAQAIPLMIVGFFLFPRIPGPLWGVEQASSTAVTGLSSEMSIGHITELGVSDEIAFRVAFDGAAPRAQDLYWRGPIMWHTDGRTWTAGHIGDGPAHPLRSSGPVYRYSVTIEPHYERWLFGLDAVTQFDGDARRTSDGRLLSRKRLKRRQRYTLESQTDFKITTITESERSAALKLPKNFHPLTRRLAASWRASSSNDAEIVDKALKHFNRQPFNYTLTPRALRGDSIDEFLFDSREGFCEHYAAAFVTLMRAAQVPARVVTGYQGGEYNSLSDYMIVRQRDAHAWAEVYLDPLGWIRVDPTGAVAPERVSLGISRALPQRSLLPILGSDFGSLNLLRGVGDLWDAMNYNWSQWVLGYTPKRQRQLLEDFGLEDWHYANLIFMLTAGLALLMALIAVFVLRSRPPRVDLAAHAYALFCHKLTRIGFTREPSEGAVDFAQRVTCIRADLSEDIDAITRLYTTVRYAKVQTRADQLIYRVKRFKPRKL
ncbi:MAG: transglutaminase-like putative cysteine protease [Gammaproteobacteria bacterium]|jgi:transglutaminase-like putative cysteine protease